MRPLQLRLVFDHQRVREVLRCKHFAHYLIHVRNPANRQRVGASDGARPLTTLGEHFHLARQNFILSKESSYHTSVLALWVCFAYFWHKVGIIDNIDTLRNLILRLKSFDVFDYRQFQKRNRVALKHFGQQDLRRYRFNVHFRLAKLTRDGGCRHDAADERRGLDDNSFKLKAIIAKILLQESPCFLGLLHAVDG